MDEIVRVDGLAGGDGAAHSCLSILLVDDEARILSALHRLLHETYYVEKTDSPEEALRRLQQKEFALLITDQRMPIMEGTELCARAADVAPETKRVILTGYSDMKAALDAINQGAVYRFMLKPWRDDEMLAMVEDAVHHYNLAEENRRLNALTAKQNIELQHLNQRLAEFNTKLQEKVFERTREVTELNDKITRYFRGATDLLARLAAMHSQVLGNHGRRVAQLAVSIGSEYGLDEKELADLEIAATLHDIGKIGMDPKILAGEEGSDQEKAVLLTHPAVGAGLIARIPGLEPAAEIVRHHHERHAGDGYPDGLRGTAIPRGARILAVADAFDNYVNLTSRYPEVNVNGALAHVESHSGTQFDPDVVRVLSVLVRSGRLEIPESDEVEIALRELRAGMVLARDLKSSRGVVLLSKDEMVTADSLARVLNAVTSDPVIAGPFVYRSFPPRRNQERPG